jgi:hypothetical protein
MITTLKCFSMLGLAFGGGLFAEAIGEGSAVSIGLMILLLLGAMRLASTLRGIKDNQKVTNARLTNIETMLHIKSIVKLSEETTTT